MLLDKKDLEKYLEKQIFKIAPDREICNSVCEYNRDVYNISRSLTSDYISIRKPLEEANEFMLFCLLDSIEHAKKINKSKISEFFLEKEINTYRSSKMPDNSIKFPLKFKMIQVTDDQWIGSIDFKMLMKLRAAQLINYNENAQRTMQKIVKGDKEYYKISINNKSVNEIAESYSKEEYIPTPFTFNIPYESDADFYYNKDTCELVIKSLEHFDITDGYHRFLGACRVCDRDPNFNYTMELRITNFYEDKAGHFVHQEEQKTHMTKIDGDSLDMYKTANTTVKAINESPRCHFQGLISRNKGIIDFGWFADLVHYYYFRGELSVAKKNQIKIEAINELIENLNMLAEYNVKYISNPFSYKQLFAIMVCFDYFNNKDKTNMCKIIDEVIEKLEYVKGVSFHAKKTKTRMVNEVKKIIMEVV